MNANRHTPQSTTGFGLVGRTYAASAMFALVTAIAVLAQPVPDCGTMALRALARQMRREGKLAEVLQRTTTPPNGFSLAELQKLAADAGIDLVAVKGGGPGNLPVPCIVHWHQGHYSAILAARGDSLLVADVQGSTPSWLPKTTVWRWSSCCFLAPPKDVPAGWPVLTDTEAAAVRGGMLPANPDRALLDDSADEDCPTDEEPIWFPNDSDSKASNDPTACPTEDRCPPGQRDGGCPTKGMPVWRVSEPFINLWVKDVPLYYPMSNGRILPFILRYRQRNANENTNVFSVGKSWECSWLAFMEDAGTNGLHFHVPGGGRRPYQLDTRGMMGEVVSLGNGGASYSISFRSLCVMDLAQPRTPPSGPVLHLLSGQQDPYGRTVRFTYETNSNVIRLTKVVDFDGRTNTLAYSNANPRLVTSVTDPYGRSAYLAYDAGANLTQVVDMQGITNQFEYDTGGLMTKMKTPYGATQFYARTNDLDTNTPIARGLLVVCQTAGPICTCTAIELLPFLRTTPSQRKWMAAASVSPKPTTSTGAIRSFGTVARWRP